MSGPSVLRMDIDRLQAELDQLRKESSSPWIDASERTPDTDREVFCRINGIGGPKDYRIARFRDQERWVWRDSPVYWPTAIQWMEIPE